ncbi:MAG: hypothetical protein ACUVV5_12350, partial [Candidatus Aminicenantales bacterium]
MDHDFLLSRFDDKNPKPFIIHEVRFGIIRFSPVRRLPEPESTQNCRAGLLLNQKGSTFRKINLMPP